MLRGDVHPAMEMRERKKKIVSKKIHLRKRVAFEGGYLSSVRIVTFGCALSHSTLVLAFSLTSHLSSSLSWSAF